MQSLETYWHQGFPNVEGWVDTRLLDCLEVIGKTQRDLAIAGHVGEIGVYHGKLLLALAHMANSGDKVTAIDVFEDQSKNLDGAGVGSLQHLQENVRLYGPSDRDYAFIQGDSIAMQPAEKIRIMETRGPFKLFSVDGCHTAEHTYSDLRTAEDMLAPGGVLILDDFMQPHWPGVTEAVNLFYARHVPRVKPFLYSCHKLFFVGYGWHAGFLKACTDAMLARPDARMTAMFGSPVLSLYP
jgi:cephalosporin hydroxylase